jgi:hypothetical protein
VHLVVAPSLTVGEVVGEPVRTGTASASTLLRDRAGQRPLVWCDGDGDGPADDRPQWQDVRAMTRTNAIPVRTRTLLAVVAGNMVPLVGVVFAGWSVLTILLLYWLESAVVGVFNFAKILAARGPTPTSYSGPTHPVGVALFFCVHYGLFWIVHGVFAFALGAAAGGGFDPSALLWALPWLVAVHAYDHVVEYRRGREYLRVSPGEQLFRPYGRVLAMHAAVLGGGFLVTGSTFGSGGLPGFLGGAAQPEVGIGAIAILVVVKTVLDVGGLLVDHGRVRRRAGAGPPDTAVAQVPPPPV